MHRHLKPRGKISIGVGSVEWIIRAACPNCRHQGQAGPLRTTAHLAALVLVQATAFCFARARRPTSSGPNDIANPKNAAAQANAARWRNTSLWVGSTAAQIRDRAGMMIAA